MTIPFDEPHEPFSFDITKAVQSHLNFIRSGGYVGSYCYGYKLRAPNSRIFQAYSERSSSSSDWPYFEVTYVTNSNYEMANTPQKFNNIDSSSSSDPMYNFQKRMNCYAYALQVYYRSYTPSDIYYLKPGEFSISSNNYIQTDLSLELNYLRNTALYNYEELENVYNQIDDIINYQFSLQYPSYYIRIMQNFVDEQIHNDANSIGFNLSDLPITDSFSLPNDFDDDNERVIAMVTYYIHNNVYNTNISDYHFYLRNGNGTCPIHSNGVCSMWTHKKGLDEVKNTCDTDESIILCDQNIFEYSKLIKNKTYSTDPMFYRITKDTNIYNSWHGYGHNSNSTSTPYQP